MFLWVEGSQASWVASIKSRPRRHVQDEGPNPSREEEFRDLGILSLRQITLPII